MPPINRWMLLIGSAALATTSVPLVPVAEAQGWNGPSCGGLSSRDRERCERARWNRNDNRRDRERERRKDAKTDGVVAGVAGTLLLGGIIAAVASSGKKKSPVSDRRAYCEDRYGNYDERSDSYRASDGRWYPCQ